MSSFQRVLFAVLAPLICSSCLYSPKPNESAGERGILTFARGCNNLFDYCPMGGSLQTDSYLWVIASGPQESKAVSARVVPQGYAEVTDEGGCESSSDESCYSFELHALRPGNASIEVLDSKKKVLDSYPILIETESTVEFQITKSTTDGTLHPQQPDGSFRLKNLSNVAVRAVAKGKNGDSLIGDRAFTWSSADESIAWFSPVGVLFEWAAPNQKDVSLLKPGTVELLAKSAEDTYRVRLIVESVPEAPPPQYSFRGFR